ncbi:MAG: hypothetical protein ACYDC2_07025 [Solirubrobacteraceae bacterium]
MLKPSMLAAAGLAAATLLSPAANAARPLARASAYCSAIPRVEVQKEEWGFHAGEPVPGPTSSYARGHGKIDLSRGSASGVICQADRERRGPERQIILAIERKVVFTSHHAVMFGVEGNIMKIHVRVQSTTDPRCLSGTHGMATIFASYNNIHEDSVQFAFPAACSDHRRTYNGSSVVTNVPPN